MKAKYLLDTRVLAKRESGGVYVTENALYSKPSNPSFTAIDKNLSAISSFARRAQVQTFLMVVPSPTYIYRDELPKFAPVLYEKEIFSYIEKNLQNADFINLLNKMSEQKTDYIYFRTDHHWTALGAFYGYNEFLLAQNKQELLKQELEYSLLSEEFYGTLSSKSGAFDVSPDALERYSRGDAKSILVWNGVESKEYDSIYFDSFLDAKDKYSYFLGSNQPILKIEASGDKGRIIIFKDSYAHIMTPMMLDDYSEIVLVDLRYIKGKIDTLLPRVTGLDLEDFDTALFLYSVDTFTTQDDMLWIK